MGTRLLKEKFKNFPIHPSFVLLFLWFVFTKNIYSFLLFISVVMSHEFGHFIVAKKLGYKLNSFFIAPYGVCLNYKESAFEQKDEILIAFAGPFVNFILSIICISLWWIFPVSYNFTNEFVYQSLMLGLFNLLPCYPLDGGRIFVGFLSKNKSRTQSIKITRVINVVFAGILFISFFASFFYDFNPSLCFCGVFMVLGLFDIQSECKYKPIAVYKKKTKNFSKPFFYVVDHQIDIGQALKKIELNKFTIFVLQLEDGRVKLIDENKIKMLSLKFSYSTKLSEIYK